MKPILFYFRKKTVAWFFIVLMSATISQSCSYDKKISKIIQTALTELNGVIQQLNTTANSVLGTAGDQVRQTVAEFTNRAEDLIKTVEGSMSGIINTSEEAVVNVLNEMTKDAKTLLTTINDLVIKDMKCLDEIAAKRIQQITDDLIMLVDKLTGSINEITNNITSRAIQIIDFGGTKVAVMASQATILIIKIILLVFALVILIFVVRYFYKKKFSDDSGWRYFIAPGVSIVVAGFIFFLFLSPLWVLKFMGSVVPVPNWEGVCEVSNQKYTEFFALYNSNGDKNQQMVIGLDALDKLNMCTYSSTNVEISKRRQEMAEKIEAILFPPPSPEPVQTANCTSFHPLWFSKFTIKKMKLLQDMVVRKEVVKTPIQYIDNHGAAIKQVKNVEEYITLINTKNHPAQPVKEQVVHPRTDTWVFNLKK